MTPEALAVMESIVASYGDVALDLWRIRAWRETAMHFADHERLRQQIRRSAGLPAGNLVTGAFRRRTKRSPRP